MADAIVEVLKEIRDETRKTNERLDETVDRLGRVEKRQVETESRLAGGARGLSRLRTIVR